MLSLSRRALLKTGAGLAACGALAGCVTNFLPRRFFVEADPSPSGLDATLSAEATAPPNPDRPLVIEVTFTSEADEPRDYAIGGSGAFPFGDAVAVNQNPNPAGTPTATPETPGRVVLVPRGEAGESIDGCWTLTTDRSADASGGDRITLQPGESVTVERVVLNDEANDTCYPLGFYQFTESYWTGSAVESMAPEEAIQWGFSLRISDVSGRTSPPSPSSE